MKYAILSINDSRAEKKAAIRNVLSGWQEVFIEAVNGYNSQELEDAIRASGINKTSWVPKVGEAGVWMSQANAWWAVSESEEPIVIFEDDAILSPNFVQDLENYISELPDDWDMFCAFVPENQYGDFNWEYFYDYNGQTDGQPLHWWPEGEPSLLIDSDKVCRAYQGYSCVALVYQPRAGAKLYESAVRLGMYTPVDCFIFERYRAGDINAYAFKPGQPRLVDVDWNAPSLIQQSDKMV